MPLSSGSRIRPKGGVPPAELPAGERVVMPASTFLEISRLYISFRIFLKGRNVHLLTGQAVHAVRDGDIAYIVFGEKISI